VNSKLVQATPKNLLQGKLLGVQIGKG
jgi:hypothetical protein